MTDHYQRARDLLDNVDSLAEELTEAYATSAPRETIADIHGDMGRSLKLADIHATLSVTQALHDRAMNATAVGL